MRKKYYACINGPFLRRKIEEPASKIEKYDFVCQRKEMFPKDMFSVKEQMVSTPEEKREHQLH